MNTTHVFYISNFYWKTKQNLLVKQILIATVILKKIWFEKYTFINSPCCLDSPFNNTFYVSSFDIVVLLNVWYWNLISYISFLLGMDKLKQDPHSVEDARKVQSFMDRFKDELQKGFKDFENVKNKRKF